MVPVEVTVVPDGFVRVVRVREVAVSFGGRRGFSRGGMAPLRRKDGVEMLGVGLVRAWRLGGVRVLLDALLAEARHSVLEHLREEGGA